MRYLTICAALVLAGFTAVAATPPRVSLTLLPKRTLPGLPVGFLITVSNPSDTAQVLADSVQLGVATPAAIFNALTLEHHTVTDLPDDQLDKCGELRCLTVPPRGERQVYISFGAILAENLFFADRRLSPPGRYDLHVTLLLQDAAPTGPYTQLDSDVQTLTIDQPTGVDAMVWNYLQTVSASASWSTEDWIYKGPLAAREIRGKYPTSAYAPWAAAIAETSTTTLQTKLANLDAALAQNIPGPLRDELLLYKGGILEGLSHSALYYERDAEKAVGLADEARPVFTDLRKTASTDYLRAKAADALSSLFTRATATAELQFMAGLDAPAPLPLRPRVECVQRGVGESFTAWFGYTNPNKVLKVIQIGAGNQVTPAPRESGQPRVFIGGGDHPHVFKASAPAGELIWHLDGNKAVATADFPTQCP